MIKVLHIIGGLNRGGAETTVVNSLKYYDWNKFSFTFLCFGDPQKYDFTDEILKYPGCTIKFITPPNLINPLGHIINLRKFFMKSGGYDIVHVYTLLHSALVILGIGKSSNLIIHSHSSRDNSSKNGLFRRIYVKICLNIIKKSKTIKVACGLEAGKYLFGEANFIVINNGVDTAQIENKIKNKNSIIPSNNQYKVGIIGRLVDVKNHEFLLRIFEKINSLEEKEIELYIIGDGILKNNILSYVEKYQLNNVKIVGLTDNIFREMNALDLLCMPSLFEGFPMVLIESQAVGLKTLVSKKIDKNVDLKLGLIDFLELEEETWVRKIIDEKNKGFRNKTLNLNSIDEKGFSSKSYANSFSKIYTEMRYKK